MARLVYTRRWGQRGSEGVRGDRSVMARLVYTMVYTMVYTPDTQTSDYQRVVREYNGALGAEISAVDALPGGIRVNARPAHHCGGYAGIFSQQTNQARDAQVYSHDRPIRRGTRRYILTADQSGGSPLRRPSVSFFGAKRKRASEGVHEGVRVRRRRTRGYILTADQSGAGRASIFSRQTNRARDAQVYSHGGPIMRLTTAAAMSAVMPYLFAPFVGAPASSSSRTNPSCPPCVEPIAGGEA
eukprot:8466076-Pyramimonas_sp.AAC.1